MVIELRDRGPEFDPTQAPVIEKAAAMTTGRPAAGEFSSSAATWMRYATRAKPVRTSCA